MGRIIAAEYLTLDGVMENPMWTQPYFDETVGAAQDATMRWADALLLGRVTYEGMSQAWPQAGTEVGTGGDVMNPIGKYVPTATLTTPEWNATFLTGDVVTEVTALRDEQDLDLLVMGSAQLSETLRAAGLIDEYRLLICPVVVGEGKKLFTGGTPSSFTVSRTVTAPGGMVMVDLVKA